MVAILSRERWVKVIDLNNHNYTMTTYNKVHIDGSVQGCSISSALAMEILQFCT